MKISKLLNKRVFFILFIFLFQFKLLAEEEPIDIWDIDKKKIENTTTDSLNDNENITINDTNNVSDIFKMQSQKKKTSIKLDENLDYEEIKILGLYDPEDNSLNIDMWSNSDGDQLKIILKKLNNMKLSEDANEIVKISLMTNAYLPKKNISEKDFLKLKSEWLIKNSDLDLIEEYLIKNQIINLHPKLTKYLVDQYLSEAKVERSCQILFKFDDVIEDNYLSKFKIYCLIINDRKEQAQLIFDLKKELGFKDEYFEKKINFLLGFNTLEDKSISDKNILNFHLAHQTIQDFNFEPNENTSKIIWKYLASSNLLSSFQKIEISELDKISTLEKATHNKNYSEKELFEIYKRFQFNINQLLDAEKYYKTLSNIEARALIYQKILLESEMNEKLKLLKLLKNLFLKDNIGEAFDVHLKEYLEKINPVDVPDNLTSFYYTNIKITEQNKENIKFNNDVLHQSKLIDYFNGNYSKSKIEKEVENFLKKIKKNKKYFFSKKDQIFLESLKFDEIEISKKYDDLYQIDPSEIPTDIQVMINNNEKGIALLRIAEVIGQDRLDRIDEDTIYFIISTLNQLDIDLLRNKILLKVLPLKV